MTEEKRYIHVNENGKITMLTEDDLPKCPYGGISPSIIIIGEPKKEPIPVKHINCRCSYPGDMLVSNPNEELTIIDTIEKKVRPKLKLINKDTGETKELNNE
jgi:hypothetical protein